MEFSNYRPVSVLPILSQVFERVLKVRLVGFRTGEGGGDHSGAVWVPGWSLNGDGGVGHS
jgi:hypothetical protein